MISIFFFFLSRPLLVAEGNEKVKTEVDRGRKVLMLPAVF